MQSSFLDRNSAETNNLDPVFKLHVELGPEDDESLRLALSKELGLTYGRYDHVAFESHTGTQFFRGRQGTASGAMQEATSRRVRALSFSIPRDEAILKSTLGLIHNLHSYEEPVVYVSEAYATRTRGNQSNDSPNKWWNRNTE